MRSNAIAFGVLEEAAPHAGVALHDGGAVSERASAGTIGRSTSWAAASAPWTSTPVLMPSRSKVAASTFGCVAGGERAQGAVDLALAGAVLHGESGRDKASVADAEASHSHRDPTGPENGC